jgi:hypothetical protein
MGSGRGGRVIASTKIDAQIYRLTHHSHSLGRAFILSQPEPARTAAPQTGDADFQTGSPKSCIIHQRSLAARLTPSPCEHRG